VSVAKTIADMLAKTTDRWAKQRKAEIRDANARFRRADRMSRHARPLNQTEAAARVMRDAYMTASANGTLPANPRQIYYAARPEMLRLTAPYWARDRSRHAGGAGLYRHASQTEDSQRRRLGRQSGHGGA
jgi:hypothetical protein